MSEKRERTPEEHTEYVKDVTAGLAAMGMDIVGERIAVVRDPELEQIGSIIVPDTARKKEPRGTIVGVGVGVAAMEDSAVLGIEVGKRAMYTKYNPIDFYVTLPNGVQARLELMHVSDVYLCWKE
jgi:co-chaperonin GroES (HSP10)